MSTRVLPAVEWGRLPVGTAAIFEHLRPEDVEVIVVEEDGEIVGCSAVLRLTHIDGLWIHPRKRLTGGVGRRLLLATLDAARRTRAWVLAASDVPSVQKALGRMGGQRLGVAPGTMAFALDLMEPDGVHEP